jgi:hypothetical protein
MPTRHGSGGRSRTTGWARRQQEEVAKRVRGPDKDSHSTQAYCYARDAIVTVRRSRTGDSLDSPAVVAVAVAVATTTTLDKLRFVSRP